MIGRAVVPTLLQAGFNVRVLTRLPESVPWEQNSDCEILQGDMTDAASVMKACDGVDTVVHLAAMKNDEPESEAVNVGGARNLREACEKNHVRKIINISTQSVKLPVKGIYASTKEQADHILQASAVQVTTLLPSVVYGTRMDGIVGSIVGFSTLPVLPVIGPGNPTYRPIHRADLAHIIMEAIENDGTSGKSYDIGGPDLLSFDQLADKILEAKGLKRRHVHIPIAIAMMLARLFTLLHKPIITRSNVLGAAVDVPMDLAPFERDFRMRPRRLEDGLRELFPPMADDRLEAMSLLRYVLPMDGDATETLIDRYLMALDRHGIARTPTLDARVRNSQILLGAVDAATHYDAHSPLRQKLLIAAAIMETTSQAAVALLPKDRTVIAVIVIVAGAVIETAGKKILSLPLYCIPGFLKRNAGHI